MDLQQWPEGSYEIASVCPSVSPSVLLGHLLGIVSLFFLNFGMVLETSMAFCVTKPDFLEKKNLLQKLSKWTKNVPKTGFFEFIEKFGQSFLLSLFCNEDLFYLLCSCTNPIFGKSYCSWDMDQNILSESDCKIF